MSKAGTNIWYLELSTPSQREQLREHARQRNWGLSLMLVGFLHLIAFSLCWSLTAFIGYHDVPYYLVIWVAELLVMWLIFRLCGGPPPSNDPSPLQRFVVRVWISYFLLVFNLGSMNTLRGHQMFELLPAAASLASFAFLTLTFAVNRRFFTAVLVLFPAGLLMAANLTHAYLIFALAWWLVLEGIGLQLWLDARSRSRLRDTTSLRIAACPASPVR